MTNHAIAVAEATQVGLARREGARLTTALGFDEAQAGKAAIVITEIASNLVKHAGGGDVILRSFHTGAGGGVDILGLDRGPGIANIGESLRDGYSTAGSSGTGLGAVRRLASAFDIYSQPGAGTAVFARIACGTPGPGGFEIGAVSIPVRGETACGDAWAVADTGARTAVLVVDGLGHGVAAADAANESVRSFRTSGGEAPRDRLATIHAALRATRGAAVAVADVDPAAATLRYAGIGNVAGVLVCEASPMRHLVSHNGIAGHEARRIDEFSYPWSADALLVMHTDGISGRWDLGKYPGLARRHPALIAGILYRDFHRRHDDATIVVARRAGRP